MAEIHLRSDVAFKEGDCQGFCTLVVVPVVLGGDAADLVCKVICALLDDLLLSLGCFLQALGHGI